MIHLLFAESGFWGPTFATLAAAPVLFTPLSLFFFFLLPFIQLKACPRELPGFFFPRCALASLASISVMSLGTRSPVDLLRDIVEVGPGSRKLCTMTTPLSLCSLAVSVFSGLSPPGTTARSVEWATQREMEKGGKKIKNESQLEDGEITTLPKKKQQLLKLCHC